MTPAWSTGCEADLRAARLAGVAYPPQWTFHVCMRAKPSLAAGAHGILSIATRDLPSR